MYVGICCEGSQCVGYIVWRRVHRVDVWMQHSGGLIPMKWHPCCPPGLSAWVVCNRVGNSYSPHDVGREWVNNNNREHSVWWITVCEWVGGEGIVDGGFG